MKDLNPSQLKSLQHTAMLNREFHPGGRIIVAVPRPKEPSKLGKAISELKRLIRRE